MQLLRYIVFPLTPIYYLVTWFRNKLYDKGILSSKSYALPIICVGNLSAGGTGKSPMIEYLIRLLKEDYKIATLSRGYGRTSKGYVLATNSSNAKILGDEPFQFYSKFGNSIMVSVCEDRQIGIAKLLNSKTKPNIILLDDAFQYRKVNAGFSILLTTYSNLFTNGYVLPLGNLREPKSGYKRAQLIVVTKCPVDLQDKEKRAIERKIKPSNGQEIFFSSINYPEKVIGVNDEVTLNSLSNFTLVTGIANAKPLINFLKLKGLSFNHIEYKDHYDFNEKDVIKLNKKELILTTEKDYMRLKQFSSLKNKLYYIPIEVSLSEENKFNKAVKTFVAKTL